MHRKLLKQEFQMMDSQACTQNFPDIRRSPSWVLNRLQKGFRVGSKIPLGVLKPALSPFLCISNIDMNTHFSYHLKCSRCLLWFAFRVSVPLPFHTARKLINWTVTVSITKLGRPRQETWRLPISFNVCEREKSEWTSIRGRMGRPLALLWCCSVCWGFFLVLKPIFYLYDFN